MYPARARRTNERGRKGSESHPVTAASTKPRAALAGDWVPGSTAAQNFA